MFGGHAAVVAAAPCRNVDNICQTPPSFENALEQNGYGKNDATVNVPCFC